MSYLETIVKEILEKKNVQKAVAENDVDSIAKCLVMELKENPYLRDWVFRDRERENNRQDVKNEIDYLNSEWNEGEPEKHIIATDEEIEHITDLYEDSLGNSEDWHYCLNWALAQFRTENIAKQRMEKLHE